jgi:hypothetical protein
MTIIILGMYEVVPCAGAFFAVEAIVPIIVINSKKSRIKVTGPSTALVVVTPDLDKPLFEWQET